MIDTITVKLKGQCILHIIPWLARNFAVDFNQHQTLTGISIAKRNKRDGAIKSWVTAKHLNSSRSYAVDIFYNRQHRYINIQFSIPKWQYGTNVYEFINYNDVFNIDWMSNINYVKVQTLNVLYELFDQISDGNADLCMTEAELSRIDICKNLIFRNADEVNQFFDIVRGKRKKYSSIEAFSKIYGNNDTIFSNGKSYSIKWYKKSKELNSKALTFSMQKNNAILQYAQKIARFEITYRKKKINHIARMAIVKQKPKEMDLSDWVNKPLSIYFMQENAINWEKFFDYLIAHFIETLTYWTPSNQYDDLSAIYESIEFQKKLYPKMKWSSLKRLFRLMADGKNLDQLVSEGYICKATKNNLKNKAKNFLNIDLQTFTFKKINIYRDWSENQYVPRSFGLI